MNARGSGRSRKKTSVDILKKVEGRRGRPTLNRESDNAKIEPKSELGSSESARSTGEYKGESKRVKVDDNDTQGSLLLISLFIDHSHVNRSFAAGEYSGSLSCD